jgi:hypothetical protein
MKSNILCLRFLKPTILFWVFLFLFASCRSARNFVAKRPPEKYLHTDSVMFARDISTLNIPIDIPVSEIETQLNTQLQNLLFEDDKLEDDNLMLKVWKREKVTLTATGNVFDVVIPLKIWAKAGKFGIYKELEFALNAKIATQLTLTPDWQLKTVTTPKGYEWVSKPVFELGFIKIPITGIIENILDEQIPNVSKELDKYVGEKVEIKKYVQQAWTQIQNPYELSKEYETWLKVTPIEIQMTPIQGKDKRAKAILGIKTYTETIIGEKPQIEINPNLPPLKIANAINDEFTIGLSGEISHKQAEKMLSGMMTGQTYKFQNGKYSITVKNLELYGNEDRLIIATDLEGSLTGKVYFAGVPFYNPVTKSVEIKNLDYEIDTKNKLLKAASWLAHGKFTRMLAENFKFPVGEQIEQAKKLVQDNLKDYKLSKGIFLNGTLQKLEPRQVYITPKSIIATIEATGKATIRIEGL